jgi:hypothetical protein
MSGPVRGLAAVVVAAVALLAVHSTVSAAIGPTVMMFHGAPLKKPVFVTGADTTAFGDLLRRTTLRFSDMGDRPFYAVAMFWGPPSDPARNGVRIPDLTPEMAWQHGRFYLPRAGQPGVLLVTNVTKNGGPVQYPAEASAFTLGGPVPSQAGPVLDRLGLAPK